MSEKILERQYKIYTGVQNYIAVSFEDPYQRGDIEWTYDKSFKTEVDAEAYADRVSEEYEFVKIEKKENN